MPWFHCHVNAAGANADGEIYILLDDTGAAFPARTGFIADRSVKREMLATALTAISTGQTVGAELEAAVADSRIIALHVG